MKEITSTVGFRKLRGGDTKKHASRGISGVYEAKMHAYRKWLEGDLDIKDQHGPVKILWKDGKPVDQQ